MDGFLKSGDAAGPIQDRRPRAIADPEPCLRFEFPAGDPHDYAGERHPAVSGWSFVFSPGIKSNSERRAPSLRSCQFIHDRPERVVVRAVAGNGSGPEEMMRIRTKLEQLLGPSMRVTAEIANEPFSYGLEEKSH